MAADGEVFKSDSGFSSAEMMVLDAARFGEVLSGVSFAPAIGVPPPG